MRKIALILFILFLLFGCKSNDITPKKAVIKYFTSKQNLSKKTLEEISLLVKNEKALTKDQKYKYKKILKKHYSNLKYKIMEQQIIKRKAIVTVEIEVNNNIKVLKTSEYKKQNFIESNGNFLIKEFNNYKLDKLKEEKSKVKYKMLLYLHKENNNWILNDIGVINKQKMLGIYEKYI